MFVLIVVGWLIYANTKAFEGFSSKPDFLTGHPWQCFPDFNAPLRKDASGRIQCAGSKSGCYEKESSEVCNTMAKLLNTDNAYSYTFLESGEFITCGNPDEKRQSVLDVCQKMATRNFASQDLAFWKCQGGYTMRRLPSGKLQCVSDSNGQCMQRDASSCAENLKTYNKLATIRSIPSTTATAECNPNFRYDTNHPCTLYKSM